MKKKAVIFDMDGLMFDTQCIYDKAFDDIAMKLFRFEMSREMHLALMGRSGQDMIDTAARYLPEGADAEVFIRRTFDLVAELVKTELRARPGLDTILTYLSDNGYPIGLASGSDRKIVNSNLESAGIGHYFAATLCGDEVILGKPHPEGYIKAAAMIGYRPEDCYVLEDSPNGILAAYRAGCAPIMVPNDVEPDQAMRDMCAGIYDSLSDVAAAMESWEL